MKTRIAVSAASVAATGALALSGCGGGDDVDEFCQKVTEVEEAGQSLSAIQGNDIEGAKDALEEASNQVNEVVDVAPDEIQDDVETVANFVSDLNEQVQDAESQEDLLALAGTLQEDAQAVQEAGQNVADYQAENCD